MIDSIKLTGGLVVHVGGSESELADLSSIEGFVIHGLHRSPEVVDAARDAIQSSGNYGKVSVEVYDGENLPHADNIVNLLFASESESQLNEAEILRVLAPGGKAVVNGKIIGQIPFRGNPHGAFMTQGYISACPSHVQGDDIVEPRGFAVYQSAHDSCSRAGNAGPGRNKPRGTDSHHASARVDDKGFFFIPLGPDFSDQGVQVPCQDRHEQGIDDR